MARWMWMVIGVGAILAAMIIPGVGHACGGGFGFLSGGLGGGTTISTPSLLNIGPGPAPSYKGSSYQRDVSTPRVESSAEDDEIESLQRQIEDLERQVSLARLRGRVVELKRQLSEGIDPIETVVRAGSRIRISAVSTSTRIE